ncbi:hypothetical protein [uncultured Rubinisphaera sp.]|uniref:hypothetical protein n=1 Tax=uncultured Rubinisphaera sp. TaxID=1678686 RepID=UPI0030DBF052|tara:strand:- start:1032 stop:1367 length:336 start_codon:yes stop_codon:yes gene_type:complete
MKITNYWMRGDSIEEMIRKVEKISGLKISPCKSNKQGKYDYAHYMPCDASLLMFATERLSYNEWVLPEIYFPSTLSDVVWNGFSEVLKTQDLEAAIQYLSEQTGLNAEFGN